MRRLIFHSAITFLLFFLLQMLHSDPCISKIYKYKDKDGKWCFTNDPSIVPDLTKAEERDSIDTEILKDLQKKLSETFPPKNKVEEARNATVAIKNPLGMGSGFFINEDGYILTNKHVIEGDEAKLKQEEKRLNEKKSRLDQEHQAILREQERLKRLKAYLDGQGKYASSDLSAVYSMDIKRLNFWVEKYERRKKVFEKRLKALNDLNQKMRHPYDNKIILMDNSEFSVSVVSISYTYDLVLLRLYGYKCPFIKPAILSQLANGTPLYAIGSPLKLTHSVTSGIYSGFRKLREQYYIQTNAQINPGNSGGPLFTKDGRVIGINTWKFFGPKVEGVGFAIPINVALEEFERYLGPLLKSD